MSIKTQKIIRFIPFLNFTLIIIQWFKMYHKNNLPTKRFIVKLLIIFATCIVVTIPEIVLDSLFNIASLEQAVNLVVSYVYTYIFSSVAIYDQEQFIRESENTEDGSLC